jgi:hypothetical protein
MSLLNLPAMNYAELRLAYFANLHMRTLEECDNLLAVLDAMDIYRPMEVDHAGEKLAPRELMAARQRAQKRRGIFHMAARPPISIIPPDNLR